MDVLGREGAVALVAAAAAGAVLLYMLIFGKVSKGYGLLTTEQMQELVFPVVIRHDDGQMSFHRTAYEVFSVFEPQDLTDYFVFGWDSRGRRFCFDRWDLDGKYEIQEASSKSWDEFDRCLAEAYKASPEIAAWREAVVEQAAL